MKVRKRTWKNKSGQKSTAWFVDFVDAASKKRVREVIRDDSGFRPVMSERAAWEAAIRLYAKRATDPTVAAVEDAPDGITLTLGELLERHQNRVGIAATTRQIEKHQAAMLKSRLGENTILSRISLTDLDNYALARSKDVVQRGSHKLVSGATILKELKLLNQALKWGKKRGLAVRPPFLELPAVRYEEYQARWLDFDEMSALLNACGDDTAPLRQAVEVLYITGLRRSEFFRLVWANVDFKNHQLKFLTMKGGVSASRKEDVVFLSDRAMHLLKLRYKQTNPQDTDLIFGLPTYIDDKHETNVDPQLANDLITAARRAGIRNPAEISPHTMRHTCATHLLKRGAKVHEVAKHLRHRDGGALLLRKYAHAFEDDLRAASAGLVNGEGKIKAQKGTKRKSDSRKAL